VESKKAELIKTKSRKVVTRGWGVQEMGRLEKGYRLTDRR